MTAPSGSLPIPAPPGTSARSQPARSQSSGSLPGQRESADAPVLLRETGGLPRLVDGPDQGWTDTQWQDQIARLLQRPENLRSVHQPVVDLRSGECTGYEALVRVAEWPARSPQPWFSAASRTGLAGHLEAAALGASLRSRLAMPGERFLAVNLGPGTLIHPAVAAVLADEDDVTGLVLCPTVPAEVGKAEAAMLERLRERGVLVGLPVADGGRAELSAVLALRPDLLVLSPELVRDVHRDQVRARLTAAVVALAGEREASVLARGIESPDDAHALQRAGVQLGQGWLFGRARPGFLPPADEVGAWLRMEWERSPAAARAGTLAAAPEHAVRGWRPELDAQGRLLCLVTADGRRVPADRVVRVRAEQAVRAAALRLLRADEERRAVRVVAVVDASAAFCGLADADELLLRALSPDRV